MLRAAMSRPSEPAPCEAPSGRRAGLARDTRFAVFAVFAVFAAGATVGCGRGRAESTSSSARASASARACVRVSACKQTRVRACLADLPLDGVALGEHRDLPPAPPTS